MSKDLKKAADAILAEWHRNPQPSPYHAREDRIQAYTTDLLRELVDLLRDNIR